MANGTMRKLAVLILIVAGPAFAGPTKPKTRVGQPTAQAPSVRAMRPPDKNAVKPLQASGRFAGPYVGIAGGGFSVR